MGRRQSTATAVWRSVAVTREQIRGSNSKHEIRNSKQYQMTKRPDVPNNFDSDLSFGILIFDF
jgi:hypothetical protein